MGQLGSLSSTSLLLRDLWAVSNLLALIVLQQTSLSIRIWAHVQEFLEKMVLKVTLLGQKVHALKVAIAKYPPEKAVETPAVWLAASIFPAVTTIRHCQAFSFLLIWEVTDNCRVVILICFALNIEEGWTFFCVYNDQCASAFFTNVCRKGYTLNGCSKYVACS